MKKFTISVLYIKTFILQIIRNICFVIKKKLTKTNTIWQKIFLNLMKMLKMLFWYLGFLCDFCWIVFSVCNLNKYCFIFFFLFFGIKTWKNLFFKVLQMEKLSKQQYYNIKKQPYWTKLYQNVTKTKILTTDLCSIVVDYISKPDQLCCNCNCDFRCDYLPTFQFKSFIELNNLVDVYWSIYDDHESFRLIRAKNWFIIATPH